MGKKIIFVFLVSIFLLEVTMRVYYSLSNNRTTLVWVEEQGIGRRLLPLQTGWFVTESKEYKTLIETNSKGWRDTEHETQKPQDVYRIVILGDSFVENFQVPIENTFFKLLENDFKIPNKKLEIITLGLGDTGTAQQYLIFDKYAKTYKPDLILHLFFTGNDVKNNSQILNGDPHRPYFNLENDNLVEFGYSPRTNKTLSFLKQNSRLVETLLNLKGKLLAKKPTDYPVDYHIYDETYSSDYEQSWKITMKLLLKIKQESEELGAKYILVSSANNEQVNTKLWSQLQDIYPKMKDTKLDLEKPDNVLREFCEQNSINCLFMLPYFKEFKNNNPEVLIHFVRDGHWTKDGSALVAKFLTLELSNILTQ
jgi:hypothetical protein